VQLSLRRQSFIQVFRESVKGISGMPRGRSKKPGVSSEDAGLSCSSGGSGRKLHGNLDICVVEGTRTVHADDLGGLYPGELAPLLGEGQSAGEIELNNVPGPYGRGHRQGDKGAAAADIHALGVKKAVCLRQPDAHGPGKIRSCVLSLIDCDLSTHMLSPYFWVTFRSLLVSAMLIWGD